MSVRKLGLNLRATINPPLIMKRSNQSAALFVAVLSILTIPSLAQSSSSGSSDPSLQPGGGSVSDPQMPPPGRPGSVVNPTDSTGVSGMNHEIQPSPQRSIGFEQIDADGDGRISLSEYTRSSLVNSGRASQSNTSTGTPGRSSETTRSSSGTAGGTQTTPSSADVFRQLDRDHDGYLSRRELDAALGNPAAPVRP